MNLITFDPTKPVQTRSKQPAEIFTTSLQSTRYPIGAKFFNQAGEQLVSGFTSNGHYSTDEVDHPNDLINIGTGVTAFAVLNVYPGGVIKAFNSQATADAYATSLGGRITSVEVNIDFPAV
jgi:hypothetical protein